LSVFARRLSEGIGGVARRRVIGAFFLTTDD